MATEFKKWQEKQTRMLRGIGKHRKLDSDVMKQMLDDIASSLETSTEQILARVREESRETQDIVASGHIQLEDKVESTFRNSVPSLTSQSTNSLGLTMVEDEERIPEPPTWPEQPVVDGWAPRTDLGPAWGRFYGESPEAAQVEVLEDHQEVAAPPPEFFALNPGAIVERDFAYEN
ncbi:hypothetical protein FRC03_002171 [Tulasnella sp. 419]|nr:hypothetical protein FRC03_002171 [Tulasnella sp. 419]